MSPEHVIIAASASNLANAVELLVRHFEGVENAATGADRGTPLHNAAQSGFHNVVEVLLASPTIDVTKETAYTERRSMKPLRKDITK